MALSTIQFIDEDGTVVEETVPTTEFGVAFDEDGDGEYTDDPLYSPAITSEVEIENDGNNAVVSDQCGRTERSRTTNEGWMVTVTGICTANESRRGNLSLEQVKQIGTSDEVYIVSDVHTGVLAVGNVVITQASDLVYVETGSTDGRERAFDFQLQLGDTESED